MPETTMQSFVLSVNDLEAAVISSILAGLADGQPGQYAVHDLKKPWGRTGAFGELNLAPDGKVFLIEVNAPDLEESLRRQGREVVIIDHHFYQGNRGASLDRLNGLSSLEQVRRLLDLRLGWEGLRDWPQGQPYLRQPQAMKGRLLYEEFTGLVSANDRGHIPTLAKAILALPHCQAKEASGPERKPREVLWDTTFEPLPGPGSDFHDVPPSWDGADAPTEGWMEVRDLVREIRLREMTLARWRSQGSDLAELQDEDKWKREYAVTSQLLDQAVSFLRGAGHASCLRELSTGRNESADPSLILLLAPECFRKVMLDALYFWKCEQGHPLTHRVNALFLFHAEGKDNRLTLVEYFGQSEHLEAVRQWFEPATRQAWETGRLEFWAGGGEGCFFGAEDELGTESKALNTLAARILDVMLTGNRPLERWRTCFLQPLTIQDSGLKTRLLDRLREALEGGKCSSWKPVPVDWAEKHYFWPHLHDVFTPDPPKPNGPDLAQGQALYSFERRVEGMHLHAVLPNHQRPLVFPLRALRLHWFYADTLVVEWVLSDDTTAALEGKQPQEKAASSPDPKQDQPQTDSPASADQEARQPQAEPSDDEKFWRRLLVGEGEAGLSVAQLADANAKLRMCFSTYNTNGYLPAQAMLRLVCQEGDQLCLQVKGCLLHGGGVDETRIVGWFGELLGLALGEEVKGDQETPLRLLSDDRCRVISSVVLAGGYPQTTWGRERLEQIMARLNTVDNYGQGHYYYPPVALGELGSGLYDRFRDDGSLYACTDHSLIYLGFSDTFVRDTIHQRHMATMYRRMFIICMFYQAIAQALSLELFAIDRAVGPEEPSRARVKAYGALRQRLMYFMNHLFYPEVSSQVQGRELFALMLKQNGGQDKVEEVAEDIHRREEYIADLVRDGANRRQRLLYYLGLPLAAGLGLSQLTGNQMQLHWGIWTWLDGLGTMHPWVGWLAGHHWPWVFVFFYLCAGTVKLLKLWGPVKRFNRRIRMQ